MTNRELRWLGIPRGTPKKQLQFPRVLTRRCNYNWRCSNTAIVGPYCERCALEHQRELARAALRGLLALAFRSPACIRTSMCWFCQRSELAPALDCPLPENHVDGGR